MMTISKRHTQAELRARRTRLVTVACLLLLFVAATLWRAPLSAAVWHILRPVVEARFGSVAPLEAERAAARAALADRDALYEENVDLKARLDRDARVERVLAGVLLRPPATPYDTLVIDAGSVEGVVAGDRVASGGTVLIGRVSEVYAHTSRVVLYSAPGERYDALLRGAIPLIVEGQGGGSMSAQAPAGIMVAVGDSVVLPGIAGGFVAALSHIERTEAESFVTLYMRLPVNLFELRYVEVWKEPRHDSI